MYAQALSACVVSFLLPGCQCWNAGKVPSPSTVRRRIRSLYDEARGELVKQSAFTESVSVSFNGYSRNGVHFLGVVVNYIAGEKYNQGAGGFQGIFDAQSGDQLACQIENSVKGECVCP